MQDKMHVLTPALAQARLLVLTPTLVLVRGHYRHLHRFGFVALGALDAERRRWVWRWRWVLSAGGAGR